MKECEQVTEGKLGYVAWMEWAEKKSKTHYQVICENCGLWHIWKPKLGHNASS